MTEEMTPAQRILAFAAAQGLTMAATFIPFSQSRNASPQEDGKPWRSLNWKVRIERAGRLVLETDYAQGEGYCPAYKAPREKLGHPRSVPRHDQILHEIETGYTRAPMFWGSGLGKKLPPPSIADVLASLSLDASVLDEGGFENWAASLGYDTDSRKAEATYRACLEIALKLRGALGEDGLKALRDAAQDY